MVDIVSRGTFDDYFDVLGQRESSNNYTVENGFGFLGRYQLGEAALVDAGYVLRDSNPFNNDYSAGFTGINNIRSKQDFLNSPTAQDDAAIRYTEFNWRIIRNLNIEFYAEQVINDVELSVSGMLGGAWLVGAGGLQTFINSGGTTVPRDGNGTPITEYIELLANYSVPQDGKFVTNLEKDNSINGGAGTDKLKGRGGNDTLDGKGGSDTAVYCFECSEYQIKNNGDGTYTVSHISGTKEEGADLLKNIEVIQFADKEYNIADIKFDKSGIFKCAKGQDLAFVIDTTGSMWDDIAAVKSSASTIVNSIFDPARDLTDSRIAIVGYNDPGTSIILPFTNQADPEDRKIAALNGIDSINVGGGGDLPELTFSGLLRALNGEVGQWRDDAVSRKIVLFGDAPAKDGFLASQVYELAANTSVDTPDPALMAPFATFSLTDEISLTSFSANEVDDATGEKKVVPVQIYTVAIGSHPGTIAEFQEIADATRGGAFSAANASEIVTALLEVINLPIYSISAEVVSVVEGDSGTQTVLFTVSRDLSESAVEVKIGSTGTADDADLSGIPDVISFVEGEKTKTITVTVNGDTLVEDDETISLSIVSISEQAAFDTNPFTVTVFNDDAGLNDITGSSSSDNLVGTDKADIIHSLGGSYDKSAGGLGDDIFVFGAEALNGIRERDVILDYEVGVDSILLKDSASVGSIRSTSTGVTIFLQGDGDAIYVQGVGVLPGNLTFAPENIVIA